MANSLMRFDPLREVARLDPFRNLEDFFRDFRFEPALRGYEAESRIRMDISETDQAYMVKAEMPGVNKDDIKIDIDGNQVTISAEIKREKDVTEGGTVLRRELYEGQVYRSFTLPQEIDDTKAEAKYHDGMLELVLPKRSGSTKKQLSVQ